jgi:tetratricopeptide (TPR) repeat protein
VSLAESGTDRWCRGLALEVRGYALRDEDPTEALRCTQRSLDLRRRSGDPWGIALALYMLGCLADAQNLPHIAKRRYRESLAHRQRLGEDPAGIVCCLGNLGRLARRTGDYGEALRLAEECRDLSRELGSRWFLVNSLILLGLISYDLGDSARARARLERALPLVERVGETAWTPRLLALLGNVALSEGDRAEARVRLEQAASRATRYRTCVPGDFLTGEISPVPAVDDTNGDTPDAWHSLGSGRLLAGNGDPAAARAHFVRALRRFRTERDDPTSLETLVEMSRLEADRGRPERGAEWLGFALAQRVLSPRARVRAEETLDRLRDALAGPVFEQALARGRERRFADLDEEITAL